MPRSSHGGERRAAPWVAAEALVATAIALAISARFASELPWLLVPLVILALRGDRPESYGLDLRLRPPSFRQHLGLGVLLLAVYTALHAAFAIGWQHRSFVPRFDFRPLAGLGLEILAVAVPEEVFFRGYLQARCDAELGARWRVAGASVGPGLLLQAAVFAACHLVEGGWTRLQVFFFALLAGWLRSRSGSVAAPAVYHGIGNVWVRIVEGWFR